MFRNASSVLFKVLAQIINKYSDSAGEVMPLWKYGNSVTVIKDTPVQFIDQLNKFLVQELAKQDFKDKLIAAGAEPVNISPA